MTKIAIYGLIDPRDGELKYVGKAKDPKERLHTHLKDCNRSNTPKNAWLRCLKNIGVKPELTIIEWVDEENWPEAEKKWIRYFSEKNECLKNIDPGGRGRNNFKVSEETRKKLSIAGKGRKHSQQSIELMRIKNIGKVNTYETRQKISAANTGRKRSPDFKMNVSFRFKGKPKSESQKEKIRQSNKGKFVSDSTREKISNSRKGWKPSKKTTEAQILKCRGSGNGRAKLRDEDIKIIRDRRASGETLQQIARCFNVSFSAIHRIVIGRTWTHV